MRKIEIMLSFFIPACNEPGGCLRTFGDCRKSRIFCSLLFAVVYLTCAVGISGCGSRDVREETPLETTDIVSGVQTVDYEQYAGTWAVGGAAYDDIIADGGAGMVCSITNKNEFSGNMYTQQGGTERFASVDDISGVIENDELYFSFEDDGWGGKGVLHIQFAEDKIMIETSEYQMADENLVGYGINGVYEMSRVTGAESFDSSTDKSETGESGNESGEELPHEAAKEPINGVSQGVMDGAGDGLPQGVTNRPGDESVGELTYEEMSEKFHEKFYAGLSWEEIEERVMEGNSYYRASKYYDEISAYWEQTREVTDISNTIEPLYFTDMKYYSEEDFQSAPQIVIHLAKNEIYAKHGYIFRDEDLNNYFMGCAWYQPVYDSDEFDDAVFNDYEKKNLELLSVMDKQ